MTPPVASPAARAVAAFSRFERARQVRERIAAASRPPLVALSFPTGGPSLLEEEPGDDPEVYRALDLEFRAEMAAIREIRIAARSDANRPCAIVLPDGRLAVALADQDGRPADIEGGAIQVIDRLVQAG